MNKFKILLIFTMCIMLTVLPAQAEDIVYGDLTGNGSVAVGDAIVVLRYVVGLTTLDDSQRQAADVNGDGSINVADAILILRYIVGLIGELPHLADILSELFVHFIDVGQGDSILIVAPNGSTMLIDGGSRSRGDTVLDYLSQAGIEELDIVVATHPHEDHIGGLITIMETLPVGKVIDSGKAHTTETYQDYLDIIGEKDIPVELGRAGQTIDIDPQVEIKILHPGNDIDHLTINNASVVVKVVHNEVAFLFKGDAEGTAEYEMTERYYNGDFDLYKIDVLKVGHHGSRTSTSHAWAHTIEPSSAVIMCGEGNPYGHPHQEALNNLATVSADVYRTDIHGDIVFTSNGTSYSVNKEPFEYDPVYPIPDPDPTPGNVDINSASHQDLQEIIHIGPERADWIINNRPFSSLDDLIDCPGIGPARLQDIKDEGKAYIAISGELLVYAEAA